MRQFVSNNKRVSGTGTQGYTRKNWDELVFFIDKSNWGAKGITKRCIRVKLW